jgi:hypothetical protein
MSKASGLPRAAALLTTLMILGGCALTPHRSECRPRPGLERLLPTEILLLGERHDAPQHQDMQRQTVQWLAQRGCWRRW